MIAGLTAIVTDHNYNSEIVANGTDGIVYDPVTGKLWAAIEALDKDRDKLLSFRRASRDSAEKYYIENYLDDIVRQLTD